MRRQLSCIRLPLGLLVTLALLTLALLTLACTEEDGLQQSTGAAGPRTGTPLAATAAPKVSPAPAAGRQSAVVERVVDGDTIDVDIEGKVYRLRYIGIDTPETVDPNRPIGCFGPEASRRNRELVERRTVELEKDISETDRFGRLLRYVWVDGVMVNAQLAQEGFAQASTYPPDVKYQQLFLELQRQARQANAGLWGGCASPTPAPQAGVCEYPGSSEPVIKGNISLNTGERIYHVPGGRFYEDTVIDPARGERWFCTEAEAVAGGWRRSRS